MKIKNKTLGMSLTQRFQNKASGNDAIKVEASEVAFGQMQASSLKEYKALITIYVGKGGLTVVGDDFEEWIDSKEGDESEDIQSIPDLDTPIICEQELFLTLRYPFEKSLKVSIPNDEKTLRGIIKSVRRGYNEMYTGSSSQELEMLYNMKVSSPKFGIAYHEMGDLQIDGVELDMETGEVMVMIGS